MVTFYCSVALRQRRQRGRLFCLRHGCSRQWSRRVEHRNVLTVDTLGSRVRVCVCLSLCPCVSVCPFSWQIGLWEKCPYKWRLLSTLHLFAVRFIPLISDGENRRWHKFNPLQHCDSHTWITSDYLQAGMAEPSMKLHNHMEASPKSGISVPLRTSHFSACLGLTTEAFINHCQASLSLSSHSQP